MSDGSSGPTRRVAVSSAASVVPALLGYHPADAIVMLCLRGPASGVDLVASVDLPRTDRDTADVVSALVGCARQNADRVMLVGYGDEPVNLDGLVAAISEHRPVVEVIWLGNGPHPVDPALETQVVLEGRAILPDRAAVARSVEFQPGIGGPASANIASQLATTFGRDQFIAGAVTDRAVLPDLIAAAQDTPDDDPQAPEVLASLAIVAYRFGDGALSRAALARSLRCDPQHRLSLLTSAAIAAGIPPQAMAVMPTADPARG